MRATKHVLRRALFATALFVTLSCETLLRPGVSASPESNPVPRVDEPPPIDQVQARIERAFQGGEADLLAKALSRRAKIFVSAPDLDIADGYYGADQLVLLLRRAFAGRSTLRFTVQPPPAARHRSARPVLVARWRCRDESRGEEDLRISFLLASEGPDLVIREIRQSR